MSYISGIEVDYKQTGNDTASTYVTITSLNGVMAKGLWKTYEDYLDVGVGYNYVAKVLDKHIKQVAEWKVYEKENKDDIEEFERLKEKLGK
tara:strand:- start:291 stop:563 length:273 start_codon:yes stop_codon:yes gene_type:complete